jgi:hypothetical protein
MNWEQIRKSNTVRGAVITVMGAGIAYLSGQVDWRGAALLALTGVYQIIQRGWKLNHEEAAPKTTGPGEFPGIDAGPDVKG